jgi:hypothetical protein
MFVGFVGVVSLVWWIKIIGSLDHREETRVDIREGKEGAEGKEVYGVCLSM